MNGIKRFGGRALYCYSQFVFGLNIVAAMAVLFLAMGITVNVILRKAFDEPLGWVFDFSQYALVYITFLAAGYLTRKDEHIRVDVVFWVLPKRYAHRLDIVALAVSGLVAAVLTWLTSMATWEQFQGGYVSPAPIPVPNWVIWMVMPLGFLLMSLEFFGAILRRLGKERSAS